MFFKILKYRFVSSLRHPVVIICLIGALLSAAIVGIAAYNNESDNFGYPIAVVDEDGGEYAEYFIEQLSLNNQVEVIVLDKDKAIRQVSTGRIDGAFILDKDFSEKIKNNDFEDIVEFVSPTVTTSAYPVSEIVSSEIIDLWLMQLVENTILELYNDFENPELSYDEVMKKAISLHSEKDIISIEYIGSRDEIAAKKDVAPIDRAIGIYAAFVIFAIMLSGEWIFNIKKKDLQSRFISSNTNIIYVCLASQAASALVCMVFFAPLIIFLGIFLSLEVSTILYITFGMLLFVLCICSIAFIVSTLADNLTQLIVIGTSVSIINILISSLAMPLPNWASTAGLAAKIFPGTYLSGCYEDNIKLLMLLIVTAVWMFIGYLSIIRIKRSIKD